MRALPLGVAESLASGATRFCRCWRLTRRDNVVMGFTDHDRDLTFDNVLYQADSGVTATAIERSTGLSVDTHSVSGALQSAAITEADIERGLYEGAEILMYMVDWSEVANRVLLSRGQIGEIRRRDGAFEAEIAGLAEQLNQPVGRAYLHSCDCGGGNAHCGLDLAAPDFNATGTVSVAPSGAEIVCAGLDGFETGWFTNGALTWTSGANAGSSAHIKQHLTGGTLHLWLSAPMPVAVGDGFELTAGCPKTADAYLEKFGSLENFRGFPHMPGDDWVTGYPTEGGIHDGGSLYRS
ncbi:MAG: DUF2163 domain-containing protein [Pseudomonadota bacterium]